MLLGSVGKLWLKASGDPLAVLGRRGSELPLAGGSCPLVGKMETVVDGLIWMGEMAASSIGRCRETCTTPGLEGSRFSASMALQQQD